MLLGVPEAPAEVGLQRFLVLKNISAHVALVRTAASARSAVRRGRHCRAASCRSSCSRGRGCCGCVSCCRGRRCRRGVVPREHLLSEPPVLLEPFLVQLMLLLQEHGRRQRGRCLHGKVRMGAHSRAQRNRGQSQEKSRHGRQYAYPGQERSSCLSPCRDGVF